LVLPLSIEIASARLGVLQISTEAPDASASRRVIFAAHDLQARIHLGADQGTRHRVENAALNWESLHATAQARISTDAPFALDVRLDVQPLPLAASAPASSASGADAGARLKWTLPKWAAYAQVQGSLIEPVVQTRLQASALKDECAGAPAQAASQAVAAHNKKTRLKTSSPTAIRPAPCSQAEKWHQKPSQSLTARAVLKPFEAWPLGDLLARTSDLDLSAFVKTWPQTALSGEIIARTKGLQKPGDVHVQLRNGAAGLWRSSRLALRELVADLRVQTLPPVAAASATQSGKVLVDAKQVVLDIQDLSAELGTQAQAGGVVRARGRLTSTDARIQAQLQAVQPSLLDEHAPSMVFSGPVTVHAQNPGSNLTGQEAKLDVQADLQGVLRDLNLLQIGQKPLSNLEKSANPAFKAAPTSHQAKLQIDLQASSQGLTVRKAQAQLGVTQATLTGSVQRAEPAASAAAVPKTSPTSPTSPTWITQGRMKLVDFDPLPWWPGTSDSVWRKGPYRLNAQAEWDVRGSLPATPASVAASAASASLDKNAASTPPGWSRLLSLWSGQAQLTIDPSQLAGLPIKGAARLRDVKGQHVEAELQLDAADQRVQAKGQFAITEPASSDRWDVKLDAPDLRRLQPLGQLLQAGNGAMVLEGALRAQAQMQGRWPALQTQGEINAQALRLQRLSLQNAQAQWTLGTTSLDAPMRVKATLNQLVWGGAPAANKSAAAPSLESIQLNLDGTGRAHTWDVRAASKAQPPQWVHTLNAAPSNTAKREESRVNPDSAVAGARTVAALQGQGGLLWGEGASASQPKGWRGTVAQLTLRDLGVSGATPWIQTENLQAQMSWAQGDAAAVGVSKEPPFQVSVQAGKAQILNAALRWKQLLWQAPMQPGAPAKIEAEAELEALPVAPILARLQPSFGWGGDLSVVAKVSVKSAPKFMADVVIERSRGDLSVTDEAGTQTLGLSDLRLGLNVNDGVWSFTQGLAGSTLGQAAGAIVARTSPSATWPAPETPIEGVLELQVANLGTWGTWVPAGWRLSGALRTSASIGGRFGAPEYEGEVRGNNIGLRNFLQGVNVRDGDVNIRLQGATARIEKITARAGAGTLSLQGEATWGALGVPPKARLDVVADRFLLLGRVDRRLVASGKAKLQFVQDALSLEGQLRVDEGLFDISQGNAPSLSGDVKVLRKPGVERSDEVLAPAEESRSAMLFKEADLNLEVNLGDKLRLRGHGLETRLTGDLVVTSPKGQRQLSLNGTVRAQDGIYNAYGQKLTVDRGLLIFNGPLDNPRLDIEATRPNLDLRVGAAVTGMASNPRIRLFSEPEMSEMDKLSWLVLGRGSDGLGRAETALLQRAAVALLLGEGENPTSQITQAMGLDELSLRQTEGDTRDTVISLGKQLSKRWYLGYERGLNATTGTWQLVYRLAQRFTLRAQSGLESSLDAIWTWRW
jgi:translocation and assembly module TamB